MEISPDDPLYDRHKTKTKKKGSWNPNKKRLSETGQTLVPITETLVYRLAESLLTVESMAIICGCTKQDLYNHYGDTIRRGREGRKQKLVEAMWEKALIEKDTKMMIWLSKQHLGYKENFNEQQKVSFNIVCSEIPKKIEMVDGNGTQQIEQKT